jgi:glycerate kinase
MRAHATRDVTGAVASPDGSAQIPPVLVAPDSFKGTFTAERAALALARGLSRGGVTAETRPLADGGEGTTDTIRSARGGELHLAEVHDPLGRPLEAGFLLLPGGSEAVLDSAAASGLPLVEEELRNPLAASTRGTGELIVAALYAGASHVRVAAGGSATTDGGRGAIEAIESAGGLRGAELTVLCDVQTPFEKAASVFAPQKGASPELVAVLSERLDEFASALPRDPRRRPMTGCAGGLSGGLWAVFGAELVRGTDFVFEALRLDAALRCARAVVTGEGRLDEQSLDGKLVGELARRCAAVGVDLHVVTGRDSLGPERARAAGILTVREARTDLELLDAGREIARELLTGRTR